MQITKIIFYCVNRCKFHNGNRTEWGPIRSVIIRVIREFKINDATAATTPQNLHT